jgi:hypothetical protein
METRERVRLLDAYACYSEEPLPAEEIQFLINALYDPDPMAAVGSALLLGRLSKEIMLYLINEFPHVSRLVQKVLVAIFASAEFYEPYDFLLKYLKEADEEMTNLISRAMTLTEYCVYPLMLLYLSDPDYAYHRKMKALFRMIGFEKMGPWLSMLPELPNETELRETFGDADIDSIKKPEKSA